VTYQITNKTQPTNRDTWAWVCRISTLLL